MTSESLDLELVGTPFFDAVHFDFLDWENGQGASRFRSGLEHI
ncbi:MAG: hypothetical protein U9N87_04140 [Planctomycetota bacterium]|nr:hypothetical protein [Planctomycetota bacterium]